MASPIPKRSEHRRRVNKVPGLQKAPGAVRVTVPKPDDNWHPLAREWFLSLRKSGQSQFYEPSDWAYAKIVAHELSTSIETNRPQAMMLTALFAAMADLLVTEGSRRKLRLELQRGKPSVDAEAVEAESDVADIIRLAVAES